MLTPAPAPTLILHHCHETRSMRTLWLLHEMGLPFELVIHPFGKALRAPGYLAIHPLGRVPALQDGALTLFETGAIAQHLCETRDDRLGRPPGHPERPAWLQWLHFAETLAVHGAALTQQHIVIRDDADRSPLLVKLETRRLELALGVVGDAVAGRDWLLPSGFSAVDCGVGYSLYVARRFVRFDAMPSLAAYWNRLAARPAFRAALPPPDAPLLYSRAFYEPLGA